MAVELMGDMRAAGGYDPFKADSWALGIMLFTLLCGTPPWTDPSADGRWVCGNLKAGNLAAVLAHWQITMTPAAQDLLSAVLRGNPADRPSPAQIRTHPWYLQHAQQAAATAAAAAVGGGAGAGGGGPAAPGRSGRLVVPSLGGGGGGGGAAEAKARY
jgi:serine/threonine protein kinase